MAQHVTLLTFQVSPDRLAEFEAMMAIEAPLTRSFEGCERFEIYVAPSGELIFLEHWRSEADSQAYGRWRTARGDMERLGAYFIGPPKTTVLSRMAA
jgi:quinol monooxygenase YgiN